MKLLIAPVWNRNFRAERHGSYFQSLLIAPVWNRNPSLLTGVYVQRPLLLIAPVWNRNDTKTLTLFKKLLLLIAPVWNRN